jgi:siroheme decarboxylase
LFRKTIRKLYLYVNKILQLNCKSRIFLFSLYSITIVFISGDKTLNLILFFSQVKNTPMGKLTIGEKKVARLLQQDIALTSSPFIATGEACGLNAREVINIIKHFLQKGLIRRFGAILRHQKVGYTKNALVVWSVPKDEAEQAGRIMAASGAVSHCYERHPAFQGKFNLFTMLHARDEEDVLSMIKIMAAATGIHDYLILESIEEYKKKSPEYFNGQD